MVAALVQELEARHDYLGGSPLQTIYLGGGTPSLLNRLELDQLFDTISRIHRLDEDPEITLEANPDDLTLEKLRELRKTMVNRLSIGIQSFAAADLTIMNRAHTVEEARSCIENALAVGFDNLTIDLIYGTPGLSDEQWQANIQTLIDYDIPHISAYCLTVEEKTALDHFVRAGKVPAVDEEQAARQFNLLVDLLERAGYEQYEISNFARPGHYALHNSNYWRGEPYLGIGPSAHSFDGATRHWNVANNAKYIREMLAGNGVVEGMERLTPSQRYNEYVMTSLRTSWGCRLGQITPAFRPHFQRAIQPFVDRDQVICDGDIYRLTRTGKLLADRIAMEVFAD